MWCTIYLKNEKAVAIHLLSANETEEIKTSGSKRVLVADVLDQLSDFSDGIHKSVKHGLVICKVPTLMQYVRGVL